MRLINTATLELEIFSNATNRPSYAILSHRWGHDGEVTFEDMQRPHRKWMPGWEKIQFCCKQARAEGFPYAWVDTCCINKESSAELSEAINSMYDWYAHAATCYAYLNDVQKSATIAPLADAVVQSKWFTRAWTLQELIAPTSVTFFDAEFTRLGDKNEFARQIEKATHIPSRLLENPHRLASYSIALKMSWVAQREATRSEDIAYSLFGIFEVNLPLLYGEGTRAFTRLQEEIIRHTYDHTIFLWQAGTSKQVLQTSESRRLPILAPSPENFRACQDIVKLEGFNESKPYAMTNIGLQIELLLFPYHLDVYVALLDCKSGSSESQYGILLARDSKSPSKWHRTCVNGLDVVKIIGQGVDKRSFWKKINIMRGTSAYQPIPSESTSVDQQATSVYGINITAPSFLKWSAGNVQPYALIAYHDWEISAATAIVDPLQQQELLSGRARGEPLLSPSSFKRISSLNTRTTPFDKFGKAGLTSVSDSRGRLGVGSNALHIHPPQVTAVQKSSNGGLQRKRFGTFEMPAMTTGTCGIIVFDNLVHGLHALKVGFDFDFRPVVFLATHEAGKDSEAENWMRQRRFEHIDSFEHFPFWQFDLRHIDLRHEDVRYFWKLSPDSMRTRESDDLPAENGDAPIKLYKGIYGLRSTSTTNADHWTFKPYEDESWQIALRLEKRVVNGELCWELTMDREDEIFELNVELK